MYLMCFLTLVILTESVNMQSETTLQNNKDVLENWNGISFAAVKHKLSILVIFSRPSTTFLSLKSKELIQNSAHQDGNKEKVFVELPFVTIISGVSSLWKQKKTLLTPSTVSKQNYLDLKQNIGSLTPVMLDSLNKFRNNIVDANKLVYVNSKILNPITTLNSRNLLRVHQSLDTKETSSVKTSFSEAFRQASEFTELVEDLALDNNEYFSINLPISYTGLNKSKKHSVNPVLLKEKNVLPSLSAFSIISFVKVFNHLAHKVATLVF